MTVDAALAVLTALAVYQVRFRLFLGDPDPAAFQPAWAALTVYAVLWVTILYFRGEYRMRARWTAACCGWIRSGTPAPGRTSR